MKISLFVPDVPTNRLVITLTTLLTIYGLLTPVSPLPILTTISLIHLMLYLIARLHPHPVKGGEGIGPFLILTRGANFQMEIFLPVEILGTIFPQVAKPVEIIPAMVRAVMTMIRTILMWGELRGGPLPRAPGGNNFNPQQNSSRSLSLGFDQKQRIAISNHFGSLPKFKDVSNAYLIYRHIKDFVNNYKIIDISSYPLDFQILIFLTTFSGSAKQLIEPFFDHTHVIYSLSDMGQCLKMVKELFCSQFQRQALRRHYDNFKLKNSNYRVFLSQELDMFLSINDIYVIPGIPHNPPASVNMLFEDFKLGFIDSIAADIEFVKDVSKVSVQLQTLTSLQHFVENCEKTNLMV